jgi:hypothetical protein
MEEEEKLIAEDLKLGAAKMKVGGVNSQK